MVTVQPNSSGVLHAIVEQKLTALMREMEDADWSAEDVAVAIDEIVRAKWLDRAIALRNVRESLPKNFVSDGNEG